MGEPKAHSSSEGKFNALWEWLGSVWEFALGYGGDLVGLQKQATKCLSEITSG